MVCAKCCVCIRASNRNKGQAHNRSAPADTVTDMAVALASDSGWVGIGFPTSPGQMIGATAVIATSSAPNGVGVYSLTSYSQSGVTLVSGGSGRRLSNAATVEPAQISQVRSSHVRRRHVHVCIPNTVEMRERFDIQRSCDAGLPVLLCKRMRCRVMVANAAAAACAHERKYDTGFTPLLADATPSFLLAFERRGQFICTWLCLAARAARLRRSLWLYLPVPPPHRAITWSQSTQRRQRCSSTRSMTISTWRSPGRCAQAQCFSRCVRRMRLSLSAVFSRCTRKAGTTQSMRVISVSAGARKCVVTYSFAPSAPERMHSRVSPATLQGRNMRTNTPSAGRTADALYSLLACCRATRRSATS